MKKTEEKTIVKNPLQTASVLAKIFEIPIAGITLLENEGYKPFINSLGLQCAWDNHPEVLRVTDVTFTNFYTKIGDSAIVVVKANYLQPTDAVTEETLSKVSGRSSIIEIGTATPSNLPADFKDYPNEIALTRAYNRLLRRVLLPVLYKTLDKNIGKFTAEEQEMVMSMVQKSNFGTVTVEEMSEKSGGESLSEEFLTNEQMEGIKSFLERIVQATTDEEMIAIKKEIAEKKVEFTAGQINKLRNIFVQKSKELM